MEIICILLYNYLYNNTKGVTYLKIGKLLLTALCYTILIGLFSIFVIGGILKSTYNYFGVGSWHLPTHTLLISLIFTVIFCTELILEKLKK